MRVIGHASPWAKTEKVLVIGAALRGGGGSMQNAMQSNRNSDLVLTREATYRPEPVGIYECEASAVARWRFLPTYLHVAGVHA